MNLHSVRNIVQESISVKEKIKTDSSLMERIACAAEIMIQTYRNEGKVLFCGNGGSAGDAQHIAAELSGRFYYDRPPLFAEALHVNTSYLTAVANDYSYEVVYSRLTEAFGKSGDILVGLSTSGNSENVIKAFQTAHQKNMKTIAFTGETGGKMAACADILINVPSTCTPRIQEAHIMIGHILCEIVENTIFPK